MYVRCWGARGSIPVSGPQFVRYGGNTTCLDLLSKNNRLIAVDAGSGLKSFVDKIFEERRESLNWLFTHLHWDHILNFPYFLPALSKRLKLNIHCICPEQLGLLEYLSSLMQAPFFPLEFEDYREGLNFIEHKEKEFFLDSICISAIPLSHPNGGLGYKFSEDDQSLVFLTDNELGWAHPSGREFSDYVLFCKNADLLIHDAEYTEEEYTDKKAWGHSTVWQALQLALEAEVKELGLFHHNFNRSDSEIDELVKYCRKELKKRGSKINCFAVAQGDHFQL